MLAAMLAEASLLVALTVQHGPGAEACLSEPRLRRSVERRLRRPVFTEPARAQLRFAVFYSSRGTETEARIDVSSADGTPRGTRTLVTSGHCSALDDSLALSVALLVDQPPEPEPERSTSVAVPTPTAAAPTPTTAAAPTTAAPAAPRRSASTPITIPPDVAAPREPWHLAVGAALQGAWGVLPGIAPAGTLYVSVLPRHFVPLTLMGEAFANRSADRDPGSGARFRLLRVGLSLCPRLLDEQGLSVAWCFGQKIGWLRVDGFGFDHDLSERRLSYALHVGGEVRKRLFAPVSLRGYLGAELPVVRDSFVSSGRNAAELFQPSPVGVAAQIGVEAALW